MTLMPYLRPPLIWLASLLPFTLGGNGALGRGQDLTWQLGSDLFCLGPAVKVGLVQGDLRWGIKFLSCNQSVLLGLTLGATPFSAPLEIGLTLGLQNGYPHVGGDLAGQVTLLHLPPWGSNLGLVGWGSIGATHFTPVGWIPSLRVGISLALQHPVPDMLTGSHSTPFLPEASGRSCVPATPETLSSAFHTLAEQIKGTVLANLSALYTDFVIELSNVEFTVSGSRGTVTGRYRVGGRSRLTGEMRFYSGYGRAEFQHDGCGWSLVSYRY